MSGATSRRASAAPIAPPCCSAAIRRRSPRSPPRAVKVPAHLISAIAQPGWLTLRVRLGVGVRGVASNA